MDINSHRGKSGRQASASQEVLGETRPADTLTFDFLPPEPEESKFLLFKPPGLWYLLWQFKFHMRFSGAAKIENHWVRGRKSGPGSRLGKMGKL